MRTDNLLLEVESKLLSLIFIFAPCMNSIKNTLYYSN